jgi:SAM-dependent methyltransferase
MTAVRTELIPLLACPWCDGAMRLVAGSVTAGVVRDGELACLACGRVSPVEAGIWHAMGARRAARTPAQFSNVLPPVPQLYERVWRPRSLTLLSGRPFPIREELAELTAAVQPLAGEVVVDVAASEGLYARHLAATGVTAIAVDHSLPFLKRVVHRAAREGLAVVAIRALAQHVPLQSGAAHAVVIGGSLNEIGDQGAALDEAERVLRPGGRFFSMSLVRARTARGRLLQTLLGPSGISFPTEAETVAMATEAGLVVDEVRRHRVVLRVSAHRP